MNISSVSLKDFKTRVKDGSLSVSDINHASQEVQIYFCRKKISNVSFIENPSDELIDFILDHYSENLSSLVKQMTFPQKFHFRIVSANPYCISHLKNLSDEARVFVTTMVTAYAHLITDLTSEEIMLALQYGQWLGMFHGQPNLTDEIIDYVLSNDEGKTSYFRWHIEGLSKPSPRHQMMSVKSNAQSVVAIKNPCEEVQMYILEHSPENLLYINRPCWKLIKTIYERDDLGFSKIFAKKMFKNTINKKIRTYLKFKYGF